jgi:hypothetical protein
LIEKCSKWRAGTLWASNDAREAAQPFIHADAASRRGLITALNSHKMSRRYLSAREAEFAVVSGKPVECFLGKCELRGIQGIRWLCISLSRDKNQVSLRRYDTADLGTSDYLNLYEFGPLDPNVEQGDADELFHFDEFNELWSAMEQRFPGSTALLLNQGVIQDEYKSYKSNSEA